MSQLPWFRFYSETISDRKIQRICREIGEPRALVVGVWAILLSLASESPERGRLLISENIPLTADDMSYEAGIDGQTFDELIACFVAYDLIDTSGDCWEICNWDKRQPNSDDSSERVRKYRKNKDVSTKKQSDTAVKRYSNGAVTDMTQPGHVIEVEVEAEVDKEREAEAEAEAEGADAEDVAAAAAFLKQFGIAYNAKTAPIAHLDPDYIRGHMAEIKKTGAKSGLAITRMLDGDPVPGPRPVDLTRQIPAEYSDIIQH